jgi:hypothetical protein
MLGEKAGTLTLKETTKPIDSGKYGLPAFETHNIGSGTLVGHEVQARATFTAEMRPDGSWLGYASAGVIMCSEGLATFKCMGVGNMTESGGVMFHGGGSFETTSNALSELNGKFYVFSYGSDADGNAEWNLYPCV